MSLTIQQIITDAKRLAGRLKERDATADLLITESQAVIRKVNELKQYEDEVEQLNVVAHQKPHSELIANIQKENRHLKEIQQENRELRETLEEHQTALEHIMSKYRQHTTEQIYKSRINFMELQNERYNDIIRKQAERIHEMAVVMDKAATIEEERALRDEEIIARLKTEAKGLREMLDIVGKYGYYGKSATEDKDVQTESVST